MKVTMYAENAIEAAILRAGGVVALAKALGVSRETVRLWRKAGVIPQAWQLKVNNATRSGHTVAQEGT